MENQESEGREVKTVVKSIRVIKVPESLEEYLLLSTEEQLAVIKFEAKELRKRIARLEEHPGVNGNSKM